MRRFRTWKPLSTPPASASAHLGEREDATAGGGRSGGSGGALRLQRAGAQRQNRRHAQKDSQRRRPKSGFLQAGFHVYQEYSEEQLPASSLWPLAKYNPMPAIAHGIGPCAKQPETGLEARG